MCKTDTEGVDHVIPVILADDGAMPRLGRLNGKWDDEDIRSASRIFSYIAINSKNYTSATNHHQAAWDCHLNERNFSMPVSDSTGYGLSDDPHETHKDSSQPMEGVESSIFHSHITDNVFMSVIQEFGPKLKKWCKIFLYFKSTYYFLNTFCFKMSSVQGRYNVNYHWFI